MSDEGTEVEAVEGEEEELYPGGEVPESVTAKNPAGEDVEIALSEHQRGDIAAEVAPPEEPEEAPEEAPEEEPEA